MTKFVDLYPLDDEGAICVAVDSISAIEYEPSPIETEWHTIVTLESGYMGFPMPVIVERGVWVIAVLCILLYWWRAFGSSINVDPKT